jgi:hypothetical protein
VADEVTDKLKILTETCVVQRAPSVATYWKNTSGLNIVMPIEDKAMCMIADNVANISGNPTTTYQFDLQKLDSAWGIKLTGKWGLEFGYTPTLYARNTAKGTTYSVGVIYSLK